MRMFTRFAMTSSLRVSRSFWPLPGQISKFEIPNGGRINFSLKFNQRNLQNRVVYHPEFSTYCQFSKTSTLERKIDHIVSLSHTISLCYPPVRKSCRLHMCHDHPQSPDCAVIADDFLHQFDLLFSVNFTQFIQIQVQT